MRNTNEYPFLDHFGQLVAALLKGAARGNDTAEAWYRGAELAVVYLLVPGTTQGAIDVAGDQGAILLHASFGAAFMTTDATNPHPSL